MNKNIELKEATMRNENQLSAIDPEVLSAFFMLNELKTMYYAKLEVLKGSISNLNYDVWENDFNSSYADLWCNLENMLGVLIKVNIEGTSENRK